MKFLIGALTVLFGAYAAHQSYSIAYAGALNQIPQLEGDGGGGLIFSALMVCAALIGLLSPLWSSILFLASMVIAVLVGSFYQDPVMLWWSALPLLLAVLNLLAPRRSRKRRRLGLG